MTSKILLIVFFLAPLCFGESLEVTKFRFRRHEALKFERLVIEFSDRSHTGAPPIRMANEKNGDTMIYVDRASLVGAVPEARINDSYFKKSRFLGNVYFNTDSRIGFSVRTNVKNPNHKIDSFFLNSPPRLIVDAYPVTSERALGPYVLNRDRGLSSLGRSRESRLESVLCFTSGAMVRASLGFELGDIVRGPKMTVDELPTLSPKPSPDSIACYPKAAQVIPTISFGGPAYSRIDFRLSRNEGPKPASLPFKQGREEQTNREADAALSVSDEQVKPRPPVGNVNPWEDNFNRNNPPPTLGKQLTPPGRQPQLAGPGSLLPPLR